jgi:hypothetical protein
MTPHQTPPSVTDEMVEAAKDRVDEELMRQYAANPTWEEAKDVIENLDSAAIVTAALAVQPGSGWRPIADAPTTGCQMILYGHWKQFHGTEHEAGSNHVNCGHYANGWVCEGRYDEQFIATHWMPLPAPPAEGK